MCLHPTLTYVIDELSISDKDNESLVIEIINERSKNTIINTSYRPPNGMIKPFKTHLKHIFEKNARSNKKLFCVGDYNLNCLDYNENTKVKNFFNLLFSYGMIPIINKPTRVTNKSATAIDNIFINSLYNNSLETGIIKTDISDHFPIFMAINNFDLSNYPSKLSFSKRIINDKSVTEFKNELANTNWNDVTKTTCPNESYNNFLKEFSRIYEKHFPVKEVTLKTKGIISPWITKGLTKSSKQKQKLYNKFLKKRNNTNETTYKNYKNLFEKIKNASKKQYYSRLILKYQRNIKKTWNVMKEIIGKSKLQSEKFPRKISIEGNDIYNECEIANQFNNYFSKVGPTLAKDIEISTNSFTSYLEKTPLRITQERLTYKELAVAFFQLKKNKASGYDDINSNVVLESYDEIKNILFHIFDNSINNGIFPEALKIAKITPIFKSDDKTKLSNYRPISVLPVFSKVLERIMYNRVYKYLCENNLLYKKQFGFQSNHSTEHAILQVVHDISNSFDKGEFTLGIFIDLSKAFDTVDHSILSDKLKNYGITENYSEWFISYLSNRKQFISLGDKTTTLASITCGVPQGSILGPLLFLIYVNDLPNSSNILVPIMFADDTNLFYSHKNIKTLFSTVNQELNNLNEWFKSNKLSLNTKKTKYSFFHPVQKSNNIPLLLPKLTRL